MHNKHNLINSLIGSKRNLKIKILKFEIILITIIIIKRKYVVDKTSN